MSSAGFDNGQHIRHHDETAIKAIYPTSSTITNGIRDVTEHTTWTEIVTPAMRYLLQQIRGWVVAVGICRYSIYWILVLVIPIYNSSHPGPSKGRYSREHNRAHQPWSVDTQLQHYIRNSGTNSYRLASTLRRQISIGVIIHISRPLTPANYKIGRWRTPSYG